MVRYSGRRTFLNVTMVDDKTLGIVRLAFTLLELLVVIAITVELVEKRKR